MTPQPTLRRASNALMLAIVEIIVVSAFAVPLSAGGGTAGRAETRRVPPGVTVPGGTASATGGWPQPQLGSGPLGAPSGGSTAAPVPTPPAAGFPTSPSDLPNIVVIMTDDLGAIDDRILSRLPNIDKLFLQHGLSFADYYGETPLCCPGRAEFLTGQHVRTNGVVRNDARLLDPTNTIATALHDAGYQTAFIGKYLNHSELLANKTPVGWDYAAMAIYGDMTPSAAATTSSWFLNGSAATEGYGDRFLVGDSARWLSSLDPTSPFFLWATPKAPHWGPARGQWWLPDVEAKYVGDPRCQGIAPWSPPSYSYSGAPNGWPLSAICESMLTVDDLVGKLVDELTKDGRIDNTVFVLTTDNGMAWGQHGFPLKNNPYAAQMPLYFAGKGIVPGVTTALESNIDLAPTLAELAGARMPAAQGTSFADVLSNPSSPGQPWILEDEPTSQFTDGPWRSKWWAIRTPDWYLLKKGSSAPLLYDVRSDPWLQTPVIDARVTQTLLALYPY